MRILCFEVEEWQKDLLTQHLDGNELVISADILDEDHMISDPAAEALCIFVNSRITAKVLDGFPKLRVITTRSTGYDHIDVAECQRRGITVSYVPGYGDNTVAEFAFALLLAVTRNIYESARRVKELGSFSLDGLRGVDLSGKQLGVIGTGRIGKHAIMIGQGFGMIVRAFDPYPDAHFAEVRGFSYATLDELLATSDFITIHCPLTPETRHLINNDNISKIKKGAVLINTARGGIVETEALVAALSSGMLSGAGLDVLEEEGETKDEVHFLAAPHPAAQTLATILENHVLMRMQNVIVTPHNAFNTREALARILEITCSNIKKFQDGAPTNVVPAA